MRLRFQADADFNNTAVTAIQRRWHSIDICGTPGLIPDAMPDPDVLAYAASEGRVLLSHDKRTMPGYFHEFIAHTDSPGLILVPQHWPLQAIMFGVYAIWSSWNESEMRNRIRWLPRFDRDWRV